MSNAQPSVFFPALTALMNDPQVIEIMVDGSAHVYVDHRSDRKLKDVPSPYASDEQLLAEIQYFAAYMGQQMSAENPILDGHLPDGSRVNIVLPPISPVGPTVTLSKFSVFDLTADDLLHHQSWNAHIRDFLKACVHAHLNIIVAGGANSGKTTVLNVLAAMTNPDERVINVGGEARLTNRRALLLEPRQSSHPEGTITLSTLVQTATRMRPDRIILTEMNGVEALPFVEALNQGHHGALATMTAESPLDALQRIELMMNMGNASLPLFAIRQKIASGIQIIVSQQMTKGGVRRVTKVTEIVGLQDDIIQTQDIFTFQRTGDEGMVAQGYFTATGAIPRCLERIHDAGINLPMELFTPQT
jgi:pilus assembly protein CpaF